MRVSRNHSPSQLRKPIRRRRRIGHPPVKSHGRATIELVFLSSGQAQVTVTRWCDKPIMVETVTRMLDSVRHSPRIVVTPFDSNELMRKRRRGGPLAPDDTEQLRIVRGWLRVQGRMNQEVYAREQGISPATLRRWMRQLEAQGKL